jgi:hypothetical protein
MRSPRYVVHKLVHMCCVIFHSLSRGLATRPENVSLGKYHCAAPRRDPPKREFARHAQRLTEARAAEGACERREWCTTLSLTSARLPHTVNRLT